jgi:ribosomal protein S18 acetylase RimI-like enzyme
VRCTALPEFWDYSSLRVEGEAPSVGVDTLVHAADVRQGGLDHRQVEVENERVGARLRAGFEALGWVASRLVWMRLAGSAPAGPDFELVAFADTRELRLDWNRGSPWTPGEDALVRFARTEEVAADFHGTRAVLARDGSAVGFAAFAVAGEAAEIVQAYVIPSRRGRGLGGALVAAAVRAAGAPETFIVADDEGQPQRLYERLGFAPVWRQHKFTRRPG